MGSLNFYKNKRVLITGHTGFKGSWLCALLLECGAEVYGYSLNPPTVPSLFDLLRLESEMNSVQGDVRDLQTLRKTFDETQPELVLHLAAQPIVRTGYADPVNTYATNVMGTVNVLECVRNTSSVRSVLNVTTDKVYENKEWEWPYRENENLCGFDPYSNSKSCSELVTNCYKKSYFSNNGPAVSTVRAGNVIGGGDFADCRIIPDCVRAVVKHEEIVVRNPDSVRPYQHVLEALYAYLLIAAGQYDEPALAGAYNVGPEDSDFLRTGELAELFVKAWGESASWKARPDGGPHEDNILKVDCSRLKKTFCWRPVWDTETAVRETVDLYRCWNGAGNIRECMKTQIFKFLSKAGES